MTIASMARKAAAVAIGSVVLMGAGIASSNALPVQPLATVSGGVDLVQYRYGYDRDDYERPRGYGRDWERRRFERMQERRRFERMEQRRRFEHMQRRRHFERSYDY